MRQISKLPSEATVYLCLQRPVSCIVLQFLTLQFRSSRPFSRDSVVPLLHPPILHLLQPCTCFRDLFSTIRLICASSRNFAFSSSSVSLETSARAASGPLRHASISAFAYSFLSSASRSRNCIISTSSFNCLTPICAKIKLSSSFTHQVFTWFGFTRVRLGRFGFELD